MKKFTVKELHAQQSREKLITAATQLFTREEFKNVSVQDVCDEAGLTKGAFYHHFSGKEELYEIVYTPQLDLYLMTHYAVDDNASALEQIAALAQCTLNFSREQGRTATVESTVAMLRQGKSSLYIEQRFHTHILQKAFSSLDAETINASIMCYASFMIGVLVKWASHDPQYEPEVDWDALLLSGIRRLFLHQV